MKEWLECGYDASTLKHRELLVNKILAHKPTSVLDVGCGNGPDLALLSYTAPKITLRNICPRKSIFLRCGLLQDILPLLGDKSFDVVFSNGALMYNPGFLKQAIEHMERIARKGIILSEKIDPVKDLPEGTILEGYSISRVPTDIRETWFDGFIYEKSI